LSKNFAIAILAKMTKETESNFGHFWKFLNRCIFSTLLYRLLFWFDFGRMHIYQLANDEPKLIGFGLHQDPDQGKIILNVGENLGPIRTRGPFISDNNTSQPTKNSSLLIENFQNSAI